MSKELKYNLLEDLLYLYIKVGTFSAVKSKEEAQKNDYLQKAKSTISVHINKKFVNFRGQTETGHSL